MALWLPTLNLSIAIFIKQMPLTTELSIVLSTLVKKMLLAPLIARLIKTQKPMLVILSIVTNTWLSPQKAVAAKAVPAMQVRWHTAVALNIVPNTAAIWPIAVAPLNVVTYKLYPSSFSW